MRTQMQHLVMSLLVFSSLGIFAQQPFVGTVKYLISDAAGNDNGVMTIHSDGTNFYCEETVGDFSLATIEYPEQRAEYLLVTFLGRKLAIAAPSDKVNMRVIPADIQTAPATSILGLSCLQTIGIEGVVVYSPDYLLNYKTLPAVPGLPVQFEQMSDQGIRKYVLSEIDLTVPNPIIFTLPEGFTVIGSNDLMSVFDGLTVE